METTTIITREKTRHAAITGLAVVGFIALVLIGMGLAVYAARYIPKAASKAGSAAVYLSSQISEEIFNKGKKDAGLVVVPPAGDTVPFPVSTSTATTTTPVTTGTVATIPTPSAGASTGGTYPINGSTGSSAGQVSNGPLYGLPDLTVSSMVAGYCDSSDTNSFVASNTVPSGKLGGIAFTTVNQGTNIAAAWTFNTDLPTSPSYTFTSPVQTALRPGERLDSKFCFDSPSSGNAKLVTLRLDPNNQVTESNESNNTRAVAFDIK